MPRKKKPKRPPRTPKYRLHRKSGRAFVELNGRRIYLGPYESPETRQVGYSLYSSSPYPLWVRFLPPLAPLVSVSNGAGSIAT
ncbi:MAG: hypothetical protein ACYTKD_19460, partial [Planctomycetota bacterium]